MCVQSGEPAGNETPVHQESRKVIWSLTVTQWARVAARSSEPMTCSCVGPDFGLNQEPRVVLVIDPGGHRENRVVTGKALAELPVVPLRG